MSPLRDVPRGTVMQVCHVVRSLEPSIRHWVRTLGAGPFFQASFRIDGHEYRGQPHEVNVHVAVGFLGSTLIELAQPATPDPSPFNEVLDRQGEGLHHLWLHSDDFDAALATYLRAGCQSIASGPLPGIGRSAFVDASGTLGCLVELIELNDTGWGLLERMRSAHVDWDGLEPVRPYPAF